MSTNIGSNPDEMGAVFPSKIEQQTYEKDLYAQRISEIPSNMQMMADYGVRTDGQPVYLGFAPRLLDVGTDGWLLHKFTYDVSNRVTVRQIAYGDWTNRATETYA